MHGNKGRKQTKEHIRKIKETRLAGKGYKHSPETKKKMSFSAMGRMGYWSGRKLSNNHKKKLKGKTEVKSWNWKGDIAGKFAMHSWVRSYKGKPMKCEHCGITDKKRYEWSSRNHKYERKLDEYQRLCCKCHYSYDISNGLRKNPQHYKK